MITISKLMEEIQNTPEDEIKGKLDSWIVRCQKEKISLMALEILIDIAVNPDTGSRNMSSFKISEILMEPCEDRRDTDKKTNNDSKGIFKKLKSIFGI